MEEHLAVMEEVMEELEESSSLAEQQEASDTLSPLGARLRGARGQFGSKHTM